MSPFVSMMNPEPTPWLGPCSGIPPPPGPNWKKCRKNGGTSPLSSPSSSLFGPGARPRPFATLRRADLDLDAHDGRRQRLGHVRKRVRQGARFVGRLGLGRDRRAGRLRRREGRVRRPDAPGRRLRRARPPKRSRAGRSWSLRSFVSTWMSCQARGMPGDSAPRGKRRQKVILRVSWITGARPVKHSWQYDALVQGAQTGAGHGRADRGQRCSSTWRWPRCRAGSCRSTPRSLVAAGASVTAPDVVVSHWRWLTAAFIHVNLLHIFMNMWVLGQIGAISEKAIGRGLFAATYVVTGVLGNVLSSVLAAHDGSCFRRARRAPSWGSSGWRRRSPGARVSAPRRARWRSTSSSCWASGSRCPRVGCTWSTTPRTSAGSIAGALVGLARVSMRRPIPPRLDRAFVLVLVRPGGGRVRGHPAVGRLTVRGRALHWSSRCPSPA